MRGGWRSRLGWMVLVGLLWPGQATWGSPAPPESPLKARFVPDSAAVGAVVDLVLEYRLPEGARLAGEPRPHGLEGLPVEGIQTTAEGIRVRMLVDRLSGFKTGPLSLAYVSGDGKTGYLTGDPAALTVLSNLQGRPEEARLRPIRGIIPTRSRIMKYLPWALGLLIMCAAGLGILLWLERQSGRRPPFRPRVPAHVVAEREIRGLASQGLFEEGRVKEFYYRLSEILRRYMEHLRGFPAAEYTTQEIALAIETPEDRRILRLLEDADLVKFADLTPTPAKKTDDIETALAYVAETRADLDRREEKDPPSAGAGPIRRRRIMKRRGNGP